MYSQKYILLLPNLIKISFLIKKVKILISSEMKKKL